MALLIQKVADPWYKTSSTFGFRKANGVIHPKRNIETCSIHVK